LAKPEPSLRAIPDVHMVSEKLRDAWTQVTGLAANATPNVEASVQASQAKTQNLQVSLT
jgi:hypothetical protein